MTAENAEDAEKAGERKGDIEMRGDMAMEL